MFASPSGRLMVYDRRTQQNSVLLDELHFPNGLLLSAEEDFAVFSENVRYRLLKFWLKGPKKGARCKRASLQFK